MVRDGVTVRQVFPIARRPDATLARRPSVRRVAAGRSIAVLALLVVLVVPAAALAQSPGTWVATGSLAGGRFQGAAVVLGDGRVLISGGRDAAGMRTSTVEIYDPATGLWSSGGSMLSARAAHTATLLGNGKILFAGGDGAGTAELFDPALATSTLVGNVNSSRGFHTATLLFDGRVLIVGGESLAGTVDNTQLYDPAGGPNGALSTGPTLTAPRQSHTAT